MSRRVTLPLTLLLAAAFVLGVLRLFNIQLAAGDVYPEYSSLRSDPAGAKLLYDGLSGIERLRVERNYLPLEYLPAGVAVLVLGAKPGMLSEIRKPLDRAAANGDRVVIALKFRDGASAGDLKSLEADWHVGVQVDNEKGRAHRYYFAPGKDWRVIDRIGPKALVIEKNAGRGTLVFFAESDDFDNRSTLGGDRFRQVSAAIGPNSRILFDEYHLGIAQGGSIMEMARRFRLTGLMIGLAVVAALFFWRNAAGFPPPALQPAASGRLAGRTAQSGLLTLLRRHVVPRDLAAACWQEWLGANRGRVSAARLERASEIVRSRAGRPLEAAREISLLLHAKGEL